MSALDATLVAYAARDGHAYRRRRYRHRHLVETPIAFVGFQPGGEAFTAAALAYGTEKTSYQLASPGQPLNRTQLFAALTPVADWFNRRFETPWGLRTTNSQGQEIAASAPQLIVPNAGTVKLLANLGRRLSYLSTDATPVGPTPAPPQLVRFGRHLRFCAMQYRTPGQQILLDIASQVAAAWSTPQTPGERANLASLEAWVAPGAGGDGFEAAALAEELSVGPIPHTEAERAVQDLVERLDRATRDGDGPAEITARAAIASIYDGLTRPAWDLMWSARDREAAWPEEPRFMGRRVVADIGAYSFHMSWMDGPAGGIRRTRQTVAQAIRSRRAAETAAALVEAEEACSDPAIMVDYLIQHRAVEGAVVATDFSRALVKPGNTRASSAPMVRLRTDTRTLVPVGKELWWTEEPGRVMAVVDLVHADPTGPGSLVELTVMSGMTAAQPIVARERACFSILTTSGFGYNAPLPADEPFTHRVWAEDPPASIEADASGPADQPT